MISVDLGEQLEAFVATLVRAGRYNSKSEVLREAVRLIQTREARLAALNAALSRLADRDTGQAKAAERRPDPLLEQYRALDRLPR